MLIPTSGVLLAGFLFLTDRFQLGQCIEIFGAAGRAFDLDQSGQGDASTGDAEYVDFNRMRKEVFIAPTSGNLSQQIQGTYVGDQGEVEPSAEGLDIELKR